MGIQHCLQLVCHRRSLKVFIAAAWRLHPVAVKIFCVGWLASQWRTRRLDFSPLRMRRDKRRHRVKAPFLAGESVEDQEAGFFPFENAKGQKASSRESAFLGWRVSGGPGGWIFPL